MANEIAQDVLDRAYLKSIIDWETKHGIYREEKDGMIYVCVTDLKRTCQSIDAEAQKRETERKRRNAAQRAMEAHERMMLGGDTR